MNKQYKISIFIKLLAATSILVVILLLIFLIRYNYIHDYEDNDINEKLNMIFKKIDTHKNDNYIPKIIFQTYHKKDKIPEKVSDNFKKYAKDYKRYVYDDEDGKKFMYENYGKYFVDRFNKMKMGPHKADLLRYCLLYVYGGVYIDIKTELLIDLDNIIKERNNKLYTVLVFTNLNYVTNRLNFIYQGFIAVPPKNFLIKKIIYRYMQVNPNFINMNILKPLKIEQSNNYILNRPNYLTFCEQFYKLLSDYLEEKYLKADIYTKNNISIELFKEYNYCKESISKDKYGFCIQIKNKEGEIIMNGRYHDFPW